MSINANVSLSAQIPDASELTGLFGQLESEIGAIEIPALPLDIIGQLSAGFNFALPDPSNWSQVIVPDAAALLNHFPDATTLAGPLQEPLRQIREIVAFDFAGELSRIHGDLAVGLRPPTFESPEALFNSLLEPLSRISKIIEDSALADLLRAISAFIGIDDVGAFPDDFAALTTQVQVLLRDKVASALLAILSIGTALTVADDMDRLVKKATGWFSLENTNSRYQALLQAYGDASTGLAAQIRDLDFANAQQVATVKDQVQALSAAFEAYQTNLVRDLAFSEASLGMINLTSIEQRFDLVAQTIANVQPNLLADLAGSLQAFLVHAQNAIRFDGDVNIGRFKSLVEDALSSLKIEVDKLDPTRLHQIFQSFFDTITGPLQKFEEFKVEVEALIRDAYQAIHNAIQQIDLSPLRNSFEQVMGQLEATLNNLDMLFRSVRETVESLFGEIKTFLASAENFVLDPENGLKRQIEDLFDTVFAIFDTLDIQGVVAQIKLVLDPITVELKAVEFAPVIDATIDVINTVTDVLRTVAPLLVTDDLKQKLADATDFLRQVDFNEISVSLMAVFDEILAAIDEETLGNFEAEYQKAIAAVNEFDPTPALQTLQREVFDPVLTELEKIKPAELLRPIQEGYDAAAAALNDFNPTATLSFITEFFDDLIARFNEISPTQLLQPVTEALNEVQSAVTSFLHIDKALTLLNDITEFLMPVIDNVDIGQLFVLLDTAFVEMKQAITDFDPASLLAPIAVIIRSAFEDTGIDLNQTSLAVFLNAIRGQSIGLQARFTACQQALQQSQAQIGQLDIRNALMTLRGRHNDLQAALASHTISHPDLVSISLSVATLDPMPVLSPLLSKVTRLQAGFVSKTDHMAQVVGAVSATFRPIDAVLETLAQFLSPGNLLRDLLLTPLQRLFSDQPVTNVRQLLFHFLDEINPRQWQSILQPLLTTVLTKLRVLLGDALLNPVKDILNQIKSTIEALNISTLTDAINRIHAEVEGMIQHFNPAPLIQAMDETYRRILGLLEQLNPTQFIADIDVLYREDIVGVVKAISPEELLLPPLQSLFQKIKDILISFNVKIIFEPVLTHLKLLKVQLGEGLQEAGIAYERMLNAIPTNGSGEVSASVSLSASIG